MVLWVETGRSEGQGRVYVLGSVVFFFQAEDGIRDAQESRGLGDVYKRQVLDQDGSLYPADFRGRLKSYCQDLYVSQGITCNAVSYTHLTLPTIYSV